MFRVNGYRVSYLSQIQLIFLAIGPIKLGCSWTNDLKRLLMIMGLGALVITSHESAWATQALNIEGTYNQTENTIENADINFLSVRLFSQNQNLVLRLPNGHHAVFKPESSTIGYRIYNDKSHHHETLGVITSNATRRIWSFNALSEVEFLGSFPVKLTLKDKSSFSLKYKDRNLVAYLTTDGVNRSTTPEEQNILSTAQLIMREAILSSCPELSANETQINPILEGLTLQQSLNEEDSCQNPDIPTPLGFDEGANGNTLQIDARPADCSSFFTAFPDIDRGTEIEEALADHSPYLGSESGGQSFPIADYWNNGSVYVLISRDLTAASYDTNENPNGLYDQLMQDGENIHNNLVIPLSEEGQITHTELGVTTTLYPEDAQVIYLDVVVQFGVMTPEQQAIFDQAAIDLLEKYGIILRIIVIP